jgi:hypothetical protein
MKLPFFKKETNLKDEPGKKSDNDRISDILINTINEKRKEDPMIGAKIGAKEVFNRLISGMKDSKGVHIESLLCVLGSLAGYSCQASLRKEFIEMKGLAENQVFVIIEDKDKNKYYFGDLINQPLVANQFSVWSLAAGAVQSLGVEKMIDIREIFEHVSRTVGSDSYGIPRIPDGHKPGDIPFNYVRDIWPVMLPIAERYCANPNEWPIMFGMAIQEGIICGKDAIDPLLALSIAMESAIPMAKADIK